ncbi:unnamed protein product [Caenorhabditis angaria]|uniref:Cyclin-like domain-containing protein n=1 Tax=Caenorhabditis angaria TaxID=860376 RepID=A0A9P1I9U2_9PELO|nr:unnamed protein product [Caenorhabditis angaria]
MIRAQFRKVKDAVENNLDKAATKTGLTLHRNEPLKQINNAKKSQIEKPAGDAVVIANAKPQAERVVLDDAELKCSEMASDIYKYLVNHEKKYVLHPEFMNGGEPTSKMRKILIDWLLQVHLRFHLLPETLHLAVFLLDHMLAKKLVKKTELQLLGVSCMFVASKFEEVFLPDVYDYEYITENSFNKKQILQMEQLILNTIQFDLSCPSSLIFARSISRLLSEDNAGKIDEQAFFVAYNMIPKSHIAMASMSISLKLCPVDGINNEQAENLMMQNMDCKRSELEHASVLLAQAALKMLKQEKLFACKQKYQSAKMAQVANLITTEAKQKLEKMSEIL